VALSTRRHWLTLAVCMALTMGLALHAPCSAFADDDDDSDSDSECSDDNECSEDAESSETGNETCSDDSNETCSDDTDNYGGIDDNYSDYAGADDEFGGTCECDNYGSLDDCYADYAAADPGYGKDESAGITVKEVKELKSKAKSTAVKSLWAATKAAAHKFSQSALSVVKALESASKLSSLNPTGYINSTMKSFMPSVAGWACPAVSIGFDLLANPTEVAPGTLDSVGIDPNGNDHWGGMYDFNPNGEED